MEPNLWYLGPYGDMQPLPCPEPDVQTPLSRIGGTHQTLNGGRVHDTFGYRGSYTFDLRYLDYQEVMRLEALYTQAIPGSYYLVNPLRKNLLSRDAAISKPTQEIHQGVVLFSISGSVDWVDDFTTPISWAKKSLYLDGLNDSVLARIGNTRVPTFSGEPITFSTYVKTSVQMDVVLYFDLFDRTGQISKSTGPTQTVSPGQWERLSYTISNFSGATSVGPVIGFDSGQTFNPDDSITIAANQVEYNSTATAPEYGGGVTRVTFSELTTSSPRFPLEHGTLKLLEA